MKPRRFCTVLTFTLAALLPAMRLSAQQFATLSVNITDPSGGAIAQASVTVKNVETGAKRSDVANATGLVVIPGLAAGDYGLTVHAAQFSEYRAKLTLPVGQIASFPVILGVSGAKEQVKVRETAQGIDTHKSEISQVIERRDIADLPIAGRDFIDFVLLKTAERLKLLASTRLRAGSEVRSLTRLYLD